MGLSCTVSEINDDFSRKSQNLSTPVHLAPQPKGFPWTWVQALGFKNENDGLPGRERSLTISSTVWIQHTKMTDRRT